MQVLREELDLEKAAATVGNADPMGQTISLP